ncbi:hypothetical protein GTY54_34535 [Streptomyces sp. SID625]|nr:hypothetical protein [Streptomyces sp. SID625]
MEAGDNVSLSGSGSAANPYKISAEVPCSTVRGCLSGGQGINYDKSTGVIAAKVSAQSGNNLSIGPDGGLVVPTAGGQIVTGCGLTGNGAAASPVKANTQTWPYACSVDTAAGGVYCDSQGRLRSEPRGKISFTTYSDSRDYNDITLPAAQNTVLDTFSVNITNPDQCRPAMVITEREVDVWLVLPAGAAGGTGQQSDEMFYMRNSGTSTMVGVHAQSCKVYSDTASLAPGATMPISLMATGGRGAGGAYYYSIVFILRALIISL